MTNQTRNELLDILVQCSLEDTNFLENRLLELIELKGPELAEAYLQD